jgi:ankyrin repeat protein
LLFNSGADIDAVDNDLNTALHFASEFGNRHILPFLLNNCSEVSMKNKMGNTPMDISMNYDISQVSLLI